MIRILGTIFAALLGLAFGSFLNACLSRWPQGESIIHPRSHCRHCAHTLSWWENIPVLSWLILRGRCRNCHSAISFRYPLVELAVAVLWTWTIWSSSLWPFGTEQTTIAVDLEILRIVASMIFYWLMIALTMLDAENLWLPNFLTLPGIALGFGAFFIPEVLQRFSGGFDAQSPGLFQSTIDRLLAILAAAALILITRWLYKLIRHREGVGLGDAKLMALLAAWLGLPGALLSFALATIIGAAAALLLLAVPSARTNPQSWATSKLPLGTFLCIGGVVSSLWGQPIIAAYLRWAGF
jgi:leader peptidase (prepilin peptidase) / N-methyltransferase